MRLLIVEDDLDGREMLAELFRMNDWEVTAVPTTEAAILELRSGGFDVVITDEDLEGRSGSGMLREACDAGLLDHVAALMYTAEPTHLDVPSGVRVLRKPLGITELVAEAKAAAAGNGGAKPTPAPASGERVRRGRVGIVVKASAERVVRRECREPAADLPPSSRA